MIKRSLAFVSIAFLLAFSLGAQTVPPADATPFPSTEGTPFPQAQAIVIAGITAQINHENQQTASIFAGRCTDWTANVLRAREIGLKEPVKPAQMAKNDLQQYKDPVGTIWLWEVRIAPIAPPCTDLAPLPAKPQGVVVAIGISLGGNWYQSLPEDNAPDGFIATRPDGVFVKVRQPFGGWWLKK